jgi:phospholipid transport system substrate-binding protein
MTMAVGIWMGVGLGSAQPLLQLGRPAWAAGAARESETGASGPLEALRRAELALETAVHRRIPDWSPEADATTLRVGAILGGIIDYERIAKSALAADWDRLTDEQRRSFMSRFTLLTNQAFTATLLRSESRPRLESERISGDNATVFATIASGRPGSAHASEHMEYRLSEKAGRWLVYDVLVDDVSLIDGYRTQFASLMRHGGFEEIMWRMQRKLDASSGP